MIAMVRRCSVATLLLLLASTRLYASTTRLEHDAAQGLTSSGGGAFSRCLTLDSSGFVAYLDTVCVAAFSDLTGSATCAQLPALTGDTTTSAGNCATTTAKVNGSTPGGTCTNQFVRSTNSSAVPTCASIAAADLPNPGASALGGIRSYVAVSNQWINAISTAGVPSSTQPSISNLSDTKTGSGNVVLATSPTITDATINQAANSDTVITSTRATDTSPTGNFLLFKNAAAATLFQVDITGSLAAGSIPNARLVTAAAGTGTCTNQVVTVENSAAAPTCTTITSAYTSGTFSPTAHNLLSASHGDTTAASAVRGDGIFAIGASPTWQRLAHSSATGGYFKWNGTDIVGSTGAAAGTGTCTNQAVTVENADAAPTCTTLTSAYVDNTVVTTGAGKFVVDANGTATKVHNVTTAGAGLPPVLNVTDLSAQSASIAATTLYTTTASGAGLYRVCYVAKVTTAATTSSTLGPFQIKYTDSTDSTTPSEPSLAVTGVNQATTNSTTTVVGGCYMAWAKASTAIQYIMGYTSSGGTAMVYNLHMTTEAVGVAP